MSDAGEGGGKLPISDSALATATGNCNMSTRSITRGTIAQEHTSASAGVLHLGAKAEPSMVGAIVTEIETLSL